MKKQISLAVLGTGIFLVLLGGFYLWDSLAQTQLTEIWFKSLPILLILLGLDYLLNSIPQYRQKIQPPAWHGVLLIILLLLVGTFYNFKNLFGSDFKTSLDHFRQINLQDFDYFDLDYDFEWGAKVSESELISYQKTFPLSPAITKIVLKNPTKGRIIIGNTTAPEAVLSFFQTAEQPISPKTKRQISHIKPRVSGANLIIELPDNLQINKKNKKDLIAYWELVLPPHLALRLNSNTSMLWINKLANDLTIKGQKTALFIEKLDGDLQLKCNLGKINIKRINGNASLKVSAADISVDEVTQNLKIDTKLGELNLGVIEGDLVLDNKIGEGRIRKILGLCKITSALGDFAIDECHGPLKTNIKAGSLNINAATLNAPLDIGVKFGDIYLELPTKAAYHLKAQVSHHGRINSQLPNTKKVSTKKIDTNINGGGPLVRVKVKNGGISIRNNQF